MASVLDKVRAKAQELFSNLDRDKSMPGFQLAQGGLMNKPVMGYLTGKTQLNALSGAANAIYQPAKTFTSRLYEAATLPSQNRALEERTNKIVAESNRALQLAKKQREVGNIQLSTQTTRQMIPSLQAESNKMKTREEQLKRGQKELVSSGIRTGLNIAALSNPGSFATAGLSGVALNSVMGNAPKNAKEFGTQFAESGKYAGFNPLYQGAGQVISKIPGGKELIAKGAGFVDRSLLHKIATHGGTNLAEDIFYAKNVENRDLTLKEAALSMGVPALLDTGTSFISSLKGKPTIKSVDDGRGFVTDGNGRYHDPASQRFVSTPTEIQVAKDNQIKAAGKGNLPPKDSTIVEVSPNRWVNETDLQKFESTIDNQKMSVVSTEKPQIKMSGGSGNIYIKRGKEIIKLPKTLQNDIYEASNGNIPVPERRIKVNNILKRYGLGMNADGTLINNVSIDNIPESPINNLKAKLKVKDINQQVQTDVKNIEDATRYVQEQVSKREAIQAPQTGLKASVSKYTNDIKKNLGDFFAPIEDILTQSEKEGKFKILPKNDVRYQVDRALRAETIASQFMKDEGLIKTIQGVDNLDEFNQYLIARHAKDVAGQGFETGRNLQRDANILKTFSPKYEEFAKQIDGYNQKVLDYSVQSGLINADLAQALKEKYPNYVPLKRVFTAMEEQFITPKTGGGGPGSLSTQDVLKRLKGSSREIQDPVNSMIEASAVAFRQGERNKTAQMIASYKDLPGNPLGLKEIKNPTPGTPTISAFINGKKTTFEARPEVVEAAKNLDVQPMNIYLNLFRVPTRLLQMGAVGYNLPFVAGNLVKDQLTAAILSDRTMKTSLANPLNFTKALYSVLKQDAAYDDWIRQGASFTSFDIARDQIVPTVAKLRAQRSVPSRIAYTATHPGELLRAVENIVGKTEELTRVQQYTGSLESYLKEGRTMQDAQILAANASRNNTANFGRRGSWSTVINAIVPFFNAGIQGARSLMKSVKRDPTGTALKFAGTLGMPVAMATLWNIADPNRKAIYDDIPDYEKENNIILLPENPTRGTDGRWNAIKIPMPPGLSNLTNPIRRTLEGTQKVNFQGITQMASEMFSTGTGVDVTSLRKLANNITPQGLKVPLQAMTNTNLYTGSQIVPQYMLTKPPEEQVFDSTSGTARLIGKGLGVSPLQVEAGINTATAGVGKQLLNLSDKALASQGIIPKEQVGGQSVGENLRARFTSVAGGQAAKTPGTVQYAVKEYGLDKLGLSKSPGEITTARTGETVVKPTGTLMERLKTQKDAYSKVDKILSDEKLDDTKKQTLLNALGITMEDATYYQRANTDVDIKTQVMLDDVSRMETKDLMKYLADGRKEVNGKQFITNTMVNSLVDEGYLTYNQGKALKSITYDPNKKSLKVKQSGRGASAKLKVSLTPMSKLYTPKKWSKVKLATSARNKKIEL